MSPYVQMVPAVVATMDTAKAAAAAKPDIAKALAQEMSDPVTWGFPQSMGVSKMVGSKSGKSHEVR